MNPKQKRGKLKSNMVHISVSPKNSGTGDTGSSPLDPVPLDTCGNRREGICGEAA